MYRSAGLAVNYIAIFSFPPRRRSVFFRPKPNQTVTA